MTSASAVIVISCLCLCGWLTGNLLLASWSKAYIPMAKSTGLLFLAFGALLLAHSLRPMGRTVRALMFFAAVASIAFCTHNLWLNGSIKSMAELIARHPKLFYPVAHVGHMSSLTAIGFIGAGIVLLLLLLCPRCPVPIRIASEALLFGVFFLGFVGTVGYSYGTPLLYGGPHTPIALPTSILFMVLAVALISRFGTETILARLFLGNSIHARLNRSFLVAIAILMLVQGWVSIKVLLHLSSSNLFVPNLNLSVAAAVGTVVFLSVTALLIMLVGRWVGRDLESTQAALQTSERFLRRSQEVARIGNWSWNIKTNKLAWSDEMYQIFGIEKASFDGDLSKVVGTAIHPEDRPIIEDRNKAVMKDNYPQPAEYRVVWPGGEIRHVWAEMQDKVLDPQGNILSLSGIVQDITDRKASELALSAEKERLSVTLRSIGDGFIATDIQGNVSMMNRVAEELTGWPQNEALGMPLGMVFVAVDEKTHEVADSTQRVLAFGEAIVSPNHSLLKSRNGAEYITSSSWAPIKDSTGKTVGVVLVFRNVTENEKLLQRLHRAEKLDSIGVLAGGIAHDFNNLLGGIFGYMELAKKGIDPGAASAKHLDSALGVFDRAKDLTHQMLTFSKGGSPLRKVGALRPVIEKSVSFALSGSSVVCRYHLEQNLWLCDFDENQISQVFNNIVINAVEAMPKGGTIDIFGANVQVSQGEHHPLKAGRYVRISVADSGVGVPRELHERIFDPFFTTKQKGNGLGLAICYSIMQKHHGCIEVESASGKGTTFLIFIPASDGKLIEALPVRIPAHKGSGTVLIMDDEAYIREVVGEVLRRMGYNTRDAENGEKALAILADMYDKGQAARFALLDLTVPGGAGGKEIINETRLKYPTMPVFAASGYSQNPVMARPTEFGFTASIRKPFNESDLADMLNRYLG